MSVLLNHGMVVHLSDHIKGLVPRTHLFDIVLKNPEKKYVEGMKVKCRVRAVQEVIRVMSVNIHRPGSFVCFPTGAVSGCRE